MRINIKFKGTQISKTPPFDEVPVEIDKHVNVAVGMGIRFRRTEVKTEALGKIVNLHDDPASPAIQIVTETGAEWVAVNQIIEVLDPTAYSDALMIHSANLQYQDKAQKAIAEGDYREVSDN